MTDQVLLWRRVAEHFRIKIRAPARIELNDRLVMFTAHICQFGGERGLVVDAEWSKIEPHVTALDAAGYGYSCVEIDEDIASLADVLADWTWTGNDAAPEWLPSV